MITSNLYAWLLVFMAILSSAAGNLLIKKSRMDIEDYSIMSLLISKYFIFGAICFGFSLIVYTKALDKLMISEANPVFAGGGFILTIILAYFLLKEQLIYYQYFGALLIIVGIIIITLR